MKPVHTLYNNLNLLMFLDADYIVAVGKVRNTYLVRYKKNGANLALFVPTSVVECEMSNDKLAEKYCQWMSAKFKGSRIEISYNPVNQKFAVSNKVTLVDYERLGILSLNNRCVPNMLQRYAGAAEAERKAVQANRAKFSVFA